MTVPGPANYVAEGLINHNSGKTHAASHVLTEWVEAEPGDYAIVAPTFGDSLKICADGPSGFIKAAGDRVESFNKNEFVIYMKNGSRIVLASADAPDRIRGWNLTGFWADEMASWRRDEVWEEGLEFATRIGRTRRIITTTPKRGSKILKDLLKRGENGDPDVRLIRASTRANAANLSEVFLRTVEQRYAGTTLGRQELDGVLLDDVEGALVTGGQIEKSRVRAEEVPELWRIVVGVDPAVTNTKESDETGIIVAGIGPAPESWQPLPGQLVLAGAPHVYLLEDVSGRRGVNEWARQVLLTADEWAADAIVAEKNQGGDLVDSNIRLNAAVADLAIPHIQLVHASKGKYTRAEPVGALFQQGRLHVVGTMPKLEDNWTEHVPGDGKQSPDRMDACLIGGTPVITTRGEVPIEHVRIDDQVMTRAGWRRVSWSGCTGAAEPVYEVATSGGSIVATGNHRVWTQRGWVRVDALLCTDMMFRWKPNESWLSGMASDGRDIRTRRIDPNGSTITRFSVASICTSQFGKSTTLRARLKGTTSTTETAIRSTTIRRTWPPLRRWSMPLLIAKWATMLGLQSRNGWSIWPRSAHWRQSGTGPRKAGPGIPSTPESSGITDHHGHLDHASSAASASRRSRSATMSVGALSNAGNVGTMHAEPTPRNVSANAAEGAFGDGRLGSFVADPVLSVRVAGTRRVYDLTVEDQHEFVAGGLLVHNCVWAVVGLVPELGIGGSGAVQILSAG